MELLGHRKLFWSVMFLMFLLLWLLWSFWASHDIVPASGCLHRNNHLCSSCGQHLRLAAGNRDCIPAPGYQWAVEDAGGGKRVQVLRPNMCRCAYGIPARGSHCPADYSPRCLVCYEHARLSVDFTTCYPVDGYHVGHDGLITANKCTCENGRAAVGSACPSHGAEWCVNCSYNRYEPVVYGAQILCVLPTALAMHNGIASVSQGEGKFQVYLLPNGQVWAAGRNNAGQLGDNTTKDRHRPRQVMQGIKIKEVAIGLMSSFFLARNGTVFGVGQFSGTIVARRPVAIRSKVTQVSTAGPHVAKYSWYLQNNGVLTRSDDFPDEDVKVIHAHVKQISAQGVGEVPMILTTAGTAFALIDLTRSVTRSVKVAESVKQVSANTGVALVLKRNGEVWGRIMPYCEDRPSMTKSTNKDFVNNVSSIANQPRFPTRRLFAKASRIFAGRCLAFVLKSNGDIWAMGDNSEGQLGVHGDFIPWSQPVKVDIPEPVEKAFPGIGFSVFVTKPGNILATGDNSYGQFGDGSTFSRSKPLGCDMEKSPLISAVKLRMTMPKGMCGRCLPGHYPKFRTCKACPKMMMSKHVIRGSSGCTSCPLGMEPTHHQNSCWIPNKMRFLRTQLRSMLPYVIVYVLVFACVFTIQRSKLCCIGSTYVPLVYEQTPFGHGRYKQRIWRILRLPQPYKWPAMMHGGLDFSDWAIFLEWFLNSEPTGHFADFQADYWLAFLTTFLLAFGAVLPLLMFILPRPLYIMAEIAFDFAELFVTLKSRFNVAWWLYCLNVVSTVCDILLAKGPEFVEIIFSENIPCMKQLLDCFDPIGLTVLVQDTHADTCELLVAEIGGFEKEDMVQIFGKHGVEEHEIIDIKVREKTIFIATPGLKMSHPHQTVVKRKVE